MPTSQNLFKSSSALIKYIMADVVQRLRRETVALEKRVRLPPSALKESLVRLSEGSIARTEESENIKFSEPPSALNNSWVEETQCRHIS